MTDGPSSSAGRIDPRVPRFNQGVTGVLLLVAFLVDAEWVVPVLAVVLGAAAAFGPRGNLWGQLFLRVVKPALKLGPPTKLKDAAPTRFALAVGFVFLAAATVSLYALPAAVASTVGWGLALVVAALALLAAVTDICVGCEIYVWLARWRAREGAA